MAKPNPSARSLKLLRDEGWLATDVSRWVGPWGEPEAPKTKAGNPGKKPFRGVRKDAFGFGDILACRPPTPAGSWTVTPVGSAAATVLHGYVSQNPAGILLVQTTTATNFAARLKKVRESKEAGIWRASNGLIEVHGWSLTGKRGKRKLWTVRRERL